MVITGPSGSGKSTLLAILGGLLQPSTGSVTRMPPTLASIAWVLQGTNGLAARSAVDNAAVYSILDGRKHGEALAAANEALAAVGLEQLSDTRARRLSGGENQRLCIARALACDRPLILADEPTSQLDRRSAGVAMAELVGQSSRGRAVVVVTHDVDSLPSSGFAVLNLTEGGLAPVSRSEPG